MVIDSDGIEFTKRRESFRPVKYRDGNGYSIGYGTFIDTLSEQYLLTETITKEQGTTLLLNDYKRQFEPVVNPAIKVPLVQSQYNALCDLCYNIGGGRFASSKIVKLINAGATKDEIENEWHGYLITENGKRNEGLVNRRLLQANYYYSEVQSESNLGNILLTFSPFIITGIGLYIQNKRNHAKGNNAISDK
jgi:lysozyme